MKYILWKPLSAIVVTCAIAVGVASAVIQTALAQRK